MRKLLFPVILMTIVKLSFAQSCNCESDFSFLKRQIENNYAGFSDKAGGAKRKIYESFTAPFIKRAKMITKLNYCVGLQKEWLYFFKDGHIQIGENNGTAVTDTVVLNSLIEQTEILPVGAGNLKELQGSREIEGIYYSSDSAYKIAIVKSKTSNRDYAGVILSSKYSTWSRNQVKLELKAIQQDRFIAYTYNKDHVAHVAEYVFDGAAINNGLWLRESAAKRNVYQVNEIGTKKIADNIFYIQIGSFDTWNADAIDSVFKTNEQLLKSTGNLILDLRGNGGGVDYAYKIILPYIYTNPMYNIGVDVIASEDNINAWQALLKGDELPESTKAEIKKMIGKMQKQTGQFVNIVDDDTTIIDQTTVMPRKIVILVDRHCASSTEQFLLQAIQSKKVILMGEATAGVLDYANMRDVKYPASPLTLFYATTRSRRIDSGKGIDNTGIKPAIVLAFEDDWIMEAVKCLTQ